MSVSDLAKHLGLHGATVRYHLSALAAQGLLQTAPSRKKMRGRPPTTYRLDPEASIPGFPTRQYDVLAEIFLFALQANLDEEVISQTLREAGKRAGRALGDSIIEVSPNLADHLGKYLSSVANVLRSSYRVDAEASGEHSDEGVLTEFTCPFEELALKHSELICDHLDVGFLEGIAAAFGEGTSVGKLKCKGHGDDVCRFRLVRE